MIKWTHRNLSLSSNSTVELSQELGRLLRERFLERVGHQEEVLTNILGRRELLGEDLEVADSCESRGTSR